jgi:hypothetical protein
VSVDVPLDALADAIAGRGPLAYLVTVGPAGPRVVSVSVSVRHDVALEMDAGRHSSANVVDHPAVTVLWPPDDGDPLHSLLVDGTATLERTDGDAGGTVRVEPTSAIRHRVRAGRGGA